MCVCVCVCVCVLHCVGLMVYVDVRSGKNGCENRSAAVKDQLEAMGATVSRFCL